LQNQFQALPFHTIVGRAQSEILTFSFPAQRLAGLTRPSMLLSRAGYNFQVFLDDEWVFGRSFIETSMASTWNTPYLVPLSSTRINEASRVRIQLFAFAGDHTLLEPVIIGEHDELISLYKRYRFLQTDLTAAITVATGFLAILSLIFWLASGRSKMYLLPLGTSVALIVANVNYFVVDHYLPHWLLQAATHSSLDWFGVFVVIWLLEIKGRTFRHINVLWAWGIFCTLINFALPANWSVPYVEWLHFPSIAMVVAALLVPPGVGSANRTEVTFSVITATVGCLLCLFDLLVQFRIVSGVGLPRFVPILFFAVFLANNLMLLIRFSNTFKAAKRSNEELALLVSEREAEIDRQYQQLRRMELSQARMEERSDIMREIHDSMGGHLMSAMTVASRDTDTTTGNANTQITEALQSALLEMRLLIDNSPSELADAGSILGSLRARIEPLLSRAGIELIWNIDPFGELPQLSANHRLHLVRIMQECITNVLKHADASVVTVSSSATERGYEISVADNGQGVVTDRPSGNGLDNMRYRAGELGGEFSLQRKETETVATLLLPRDGLGRHSP
jgi:signal transduction histidine kinase